MINQWFKSEFGVSWPTDEHQIDENRIIWLFDIHKTNQKIFEWPGWLRRLLMDNLVKDEQSDEMNN